MGWWGVVILCNNDMIRHQRRCIRNTSQQNWHPSMVAWWRGDWTKKWQDIIRGSGIGTCPIKFPGLPAWSPVVTLSTLPSILTTLSLPQTKIVHSVNGAYSVNVHRGCLLIVFVSQKWPSVCHWAPELVGGGWVMIGVDYDNHPPVGYSLMGRTQL